MTDDGVTAAHGQASYGVRCEQGPTGAAAVVAGADLAVVVDVLSFTTTLGVAVERGVDVLPYRWRDQGAAGYAAARDALLAVGRLEAREVGGVSLSPASLAHDASLAGVRRLVLPSPNGSAICFGLAESGARVVGASLRNATAVAAWLAPQVRAGAVLAVVAAGERWPDGSLRPAVEDLWGAGAVLSALDDAGVGGLSPEAEVARDAFRAVRSSLPDALHACAGGRELAAVGFAADVDLAAALDASSVVPVLDGEEFTAG